MNFIEVEVLRTFGPYEKGRVMKLESDNHGVPLDKYWRQRIEDAKIDGCCRVIDKKLKKSKKREGEK